LAASLSALGSAHAASFALQEYSVRDLGEANAGFAALAEDASTVYSNPAGLARLTSPEMVVGAVGIVPHSKYEDRGSLAVTTAAQTGTDDEGFAKAGMVGDLYFALPVDERVTLGLGVTSPFGILIDYEPNWIGRYQATNSDVKSFDINPAVGIKLTDDISIGFGVSAQYFRARLTNAVDVTAILTSGAASGGLDGAADLTADGWAVGFNAGILANVTPKTRVGFHFRSKVEHDLDGTADFTIDPTALALMGGAFTDTTLTSSIDLPASYALSIHHQASDKLALMASVLYTRWSSFKTLTVTYANPLQPATVEQFNSDNTVRVAVGGRYQLTDNFSINAGIAFDQSPIADGFETARIPDSDRYIGATGFSWTPRPGLSVDFAYQHIELAKLDIARAGGQGDQLNGQYQAAAELFGVSVRAQF